MEKFYNRINWQNKPSLATPLGATNLNKMDSALEELDNRTLELNKKINTHDRVLSDLQAESNEHTQNIVNLQTQTESITQNIDSFKIVSTASGSPIYIDDSSNMNFEGIDLFGESTQETTTGKNLLDSRNFKESTSNGITFTPVRENGKLLYINVNGTSTAQTMYGIQPSLTDIPAEKRVLNGCIGGSSSTYSLLASYYDGSSWKKEVNQTDDDLVLSTSYTKYTINILIRKGVTLNNVKFYPMLSVNGGEYEPFTNGASPNPDYPQPIESKVIKEIVSYTGQLFNKDNALYVSGISADVESGIFKNSQPQVRIYYVEVKPNTTYTFSKTVGAFNRVCTCPNIPSESGKLTNFNTDTTNNVATITTGENDRYIAFYPLLVAEIDAIGYDAVIDTVMISYGVKALPYSQYKPIQTVNLSAPIELNGIGSVRDTDKLKKFAKITANKLSTFRSDYSVGAIALDNNIAILTDWTMPYQNMLCNIFSNVYSRTELLSNTSLLGIALATSDNGSCTIFFRITDIEQTEEAYNAYLSKTPLEVVFERAEPIETALPQADIDAIKALHSYKPNTVVRNDADAEMEVEYVADTKAYIDKKFRELATVIVNQ